MTRRDKLPARLAVDRLPEAVRACCAAMARAGGRCWLVGGAVRDGLLGTAVRDWDLATTVRPEEITGLLPGAETRDAALGAFRMACGEGVVTLTTLREEGDYRDHRHPQRVRFVEDVGRDARRRDFSCNALYADPDTGELTDPAGGLEDLRSGVLRMIGDPRVRFAEDVLRLLRAVRFSARLGLAIEPRTAAALSETAPLLVHLSNERVFEELTGAFTGPGRGRALRLLVEHGLAEQVLPEVVGMDGVPQPPEYHPEGDVLTHVCLVLDRVPEDDPVQAWSAVLHDVGKPATFTRGPDRIRFDGHDTLSATMADAALRRLRAPRELRETVVEVCRDHIRFASLPEMRPARRERWMRSPRFPAHLEFHRADCEGSHGQLSIYETARRQWQDLPPEPEPLPVNGNDVLALGVPQGPMVGELLAKVAGARDEQPDLDREQALEMLRGLAAAHVKAEGEADDKCSGPPPGGSQ